MIDVVMPKNNELEFLQMAKKLDMEGLVFLYKRVDKKLIEKIRKISAKNFKVMIGVLVDKKVQLKSAKHFDIVFSKVDRELLESKKADVYVLDVTVPSKDHIHQRNSGLNEIMCKIAKEKAFAISFNNFLTSKEKQNVLGRQVQNIVLLKKFKNDFIIASFAKRPYEMRAPKDLEAYASALGVSKPKEPLQFLSKFHKL